MKTQLTHRIISGKPIGAVPVLALSILAWITPSVRAQVSVSLQPSVPSPARVGTRATWTATVSGAEPGAYSYQFAIRGFYEGRRIVKDFGPDNSFDWAPSEREGFYTIEVVARNKNTSQTAKAVVPYDVLSNVTGGQPAVTPTSHPLVFLYSAPPCPLGGIVAVNYSSSNSVVQETSTKPCDGLFTMNFYVAGLRAKTTYSVKHILQNNGSVSEGPVLSFTSGQAPEDVPTVTMVKPNSGLAEQPVVLSASLFTKFLATDLDGNAIWYYPGDLTFLTRPEPGGYFFGINEAAGGDQSRQIVREFDLAGITVLETNAARINEQLAAAGKRPISAFHHEARRLSNGHILVLAGVEQILTDVQGPGPVDILGDMIIVLNRNLEVIWTWDAFDHLDPNRMATQNDRCGPGVCPPVFLGPQPNDWLHGNSVAEAPDGNLVYSARSQDWVIKIDYQNGRGSGNVIWRLGKDGDFKINSTDPDPWFSHQHDPEYEADGTLTLFDNGNGRWVKNPDAHSRGQVFRIDEKNRIADLTLNVDLGHYSLALGSAQLLQNGNYFFDSGFREDGTGISTEVDPSGNIVYEIESSAPEYRTFRMKNMYTP